MKPTFRWRGCWGDAGQAVGQLNLQHGLSRHSGATDRPQPQAAAAPDAHRLRAYSRHMLPLATAATWWPTAHHIHEQAGVQRGIAGLFVFKHKGKIKFKMRHTHFDLSAASVSHIRLWPTLSAAIFSQSKATLPPPPTDCSTADTVTATVIPLSQSLTPSDPSPSDPAQPQRLPIHSSHSTPTDSRLKPSMSTLGLASAAVVSGYVVYLAQPWPGSGWYPWHPALMAVAVVFLLTLGISALGKRPVKQRQVQLHFACVAAAAVLLLGGFLAIWNSKAERSKPHFTSRHGQLGLAVSLALMLQAAGSSVFLFPDQLVRRLGPKNVKQFKTVHRYFSAVVYCAAMLEIFLAFYTNWWAGQVQGWRWNLFVGLTALTVITVLLQVRLFCFLNRAGIGPLRSRLGWGAWRSRKGLVACAEGDG